MTRLASDEDASPGGRSNSWDRTPEAETLSTTPSDSPPLRIAYLTTEYPPFQGGGIGTQIRTLARGMAAQGHRVTVVGWGPQERFEDQGVRVRFVGHTRVPRMGWLLNRRRALDELRHLARSEGLDLVEAPDWCGPSAGLRPPGPVVVRCHGTATYFAHILRESVRPSVRRAEQLALRQATSVVAVSRFAADLTRRLFHLRQPIGVIPNGVDLDHFRPAAAESDSETVLNVGTVVRKKGVLDLCEAFGRIVAECPQARLVLVGRDAADRRTGSPSTWRLCEDRLTAAARARTRYLGPRPYEEVREALRGAAVCVFPSYGEALPMTWLEAMACGRAVVAYDVGWAPEVVAPETTGVLVPPGDVAGLADRVVALLRDPDRRRVFGAAGRDRACRLFSLDAMVRRTVDWYRSVIRETAD